MVHENTARKLPFPDIGGLLIVVACAAGVLASGCEDPPVRCDVSQGRFKGTLKLKQTIKGDCKPMSVAFFDVGIYYKRNSDDSPNYDHARLAIQEQSATAALDYAKSAGKKAACDDKPYAFGPFETTEADSGNLCRAPKFAAGRVCAPSVAVWKDMSMKDKPVDMPPANDWQVTYELSNLKTPVTIESPGASFTADLKYTKVSKDGKIDCAAEYTVTAEKFNHMCGYNPDYSSMTQEDADKECAMNAGLTAAEVTCDLTKHWCGQKNPALIAP